MIVSFLKKLAVIVTALWLAASPAYAAKWYVDNTLGALPEDQKVVPEDPKPVQMIFEFQTNGEFNKRATKAVKKIALEHLRNSGVFSEVSEEPVEGGATLKVVFNNIVKKEEIDNVKKDGFKAGLSFGLFGGVVATDYYQMDFTYLASEGQTPVAAQVEHALHMKYGKKDVEIPGTRVKNVDAAVTLVTQQAIDHGINQIAADPAFSGEVFSGAEVSEESGPAPVEPVVSDEEALLAEPAEPMADPA